jgi:hypothetical protein
MSMNKSKVKSQKSKVKSEASLPGGSQRKSARRSFLIFSFFLFPFSFFLSGCRQDMHDNPRFEANEAGANRQLPEGTVARGSLDLYVNAPKVIRPVPGQVLPPTSDGDKGPVPLGEDGFPFKITKEILDRGESRFNISCLPCHGLLGDGNGMIVQRGFRRPPSYHWERLRKAPTSHFYDVMTNGFGAMPSYADQVTPEDRWKIIAYIRALQLSQTATVAELNLKEDEKKKIEEAGQGTASAPGAAPAPTPTPAPTSGGHND